MAELAILSLTLPSPGLGECIMTRLDDGSLRIDHADPRVLISTEVLHEAFMHPAPGVSVEAGLPRQDRNGTPFREGVILKICGVNRTVIYRITEYVPRIHGYIGEWPD